MQGLNTVEMLRFFTTVLFVFLCPLLTSRVYSKQVVLIMTPSECVKIEKVENYKIFLVDDKDLLKKGCNKSKFSFKNVSIDSNMPFEYVEVYYNGRLWKRFNFKEVFAGDSILRSSVEAFLKDLESIEKSIGSKLDNKTLDKLSLEIAKVQEFIQSEEFREKIDYFRDSLSRAFLGEYYDALLRSLSTKENKPSRSLKGENSTLFRLRDDERIYIFVSSSLPDRVLENYVRAVDELKSDKIIFVLRGAVGGMTYIGPTINWVMRYMLKSKECELEGNKVVKGCQLYSVKFIIDPLLFRKYKIDKVPAVLYVSGVKRIEDFSEGLEEVSYDKGVLSYGDVDFYYHLYQIGKILGDDRFLRVSENKLRYHF